MILSAINNSYSALQTLSRWYWSAQTQRALLSRLNTALTVSQDIVALSLLLLSQAYTDGLNLLDIWLTPGCSPETFVITTLVDSSQLDWRDVGGLLQGDCAFVITWLGYTVSDLTHGATELYYRVRTVLT